MADVVGRLALLVFVLSLSAAVKIRSPQGEVDGKIEKLDEYGEVTKFLGIPYAKPPVSGLRFQPPRSASNFHGVHDATYGRPLCPQPESYLGLLNLTKDPDVRFRTNEDCLYLNVYIPGAVRPGNNYPVMVWIHGGSWICGSGTHYDARKLAAIGKVIVVTLNYRLGILGFLPDYGSPASTLGLQDQIEALKWVRMNIWSYGGDPGMVTIFGESAGGASVSFLSASPAARGLFHRAISQSGLKNSAWAFDQEKREKKKEVIAMKLRRDGCKKTSLYDCLMDASVDELVGLTQFTMSSLSLSGWTPLADGHVVMNDVIDNATLIHPRLERLLGFNTDEGGSMMEHICHHDDGGSCRLYQGISYQSVRKWILPEVDLMTFEKIGKQYTKWYSGPRRRNRISLRAASAFTTDWFERFPANRTASVFHQAGQKIYVYEFNVKAKGFASLYANVPWSEEAQHCDELPFLFAAVVDDQDMKIAKQFIKYFTDFAKGESAPWPQFGDQAKYAYISRLGTEIKQPLIEQRKQNFWRPWFNEGEFPEAESQSGNNGGRTLLPAIMLIWLCLTWIQL